LPKDYGLWEDRRSGSVQKRVLEESGDFQSPVIIEMVTKTPLRTKALTAQDDFDEITGVVRRELCFLSVYMGNPS